jgi:hypothetical protein
VRRTRPAMRAAAPSTSSIVITPGSLALDTRSRGGVPVVR